MIYMLYGTNKPLQSMAPPPTNHVLPLKLPLDLSL